MNRCLFVGSMVALLVFSGSARDGYAQSVIGDEALASVAAAESAVATAKASIKRGRELVALIPDDSPLLPEVGQMLKEVSMNWKIAIESIEGANQSAAKIATTQSEGLAKDYALLAKVNSAVAISGANVVQIGMDYVDAVANNKTEALDLIRGAMLNSLAASSQVKLNCDEVKSLISEKYSN